MNTEQLKQLENDLWRSADTLQANSDLKASEYSIPVLGLIFLKFADNLSSDNAEWNRAVMQENPTQRPSQLSGTLPAALPWLPD